MNRRPPLVIASAAKRSKGRLPDVVGLALDRFAALAMTARFGHQAGFVPTSRNTLPNSAMAGAGFGALSLLSDFLGDRASLG